AMPAVVRSRGAVTVQAAADRFQQVDGRFVVAVLFFVLGRLDDVAFLPKFLFDELLQLFGESGSQFARIERVGLERANRLADGGDLPRIGLIRFRQADVVGRADFVFETQKLGAQDASFREN